MLHIYECHIEETSHVTNTKAAAEDMRRCYEAMSSIASAADYLAAKEAMETGAMAINVLRYLHIVNDAEVKAIEDLILPVLQYAHAAEDDLDTLCSLKAACACEVERVKKAFDHYKG